MTITWPALATLEIDRRARAGSTPASRSRIARRASTPTAASARDSTPTWRSSDPPVATVDRFGNVTGAQARRGDDHRRRSTASRREKAYTVAANPGARRSSSAIAETTIRTGDVITLAGDAEARRRHGGRRRADHLELHVQAPEGNTPQAPGGAGIIDNGLFVGELPGPLHDSRAAGHGARAQDDRGHAARRAAADHDHRPRHHPRHAHVGPLAVHRQGRPRLLHRRHLGRRRLRAHLRHHRPARTSSRPTRSRSTRARSTTSPSRPTRATPCCRAKARRTASTAS